MTQQKREGRLRLANSRSTSGPDLLDAAQDVLEPLGLALVLCSLDSDSYPLSIVADEHADDLRRLAQELGFTLTVY
ncbi:MAG: hypothetical protein EOO63_08955 [Hymenobacter sp.]|nr:MAG: hypothetical protein EOO63_08955 [Hymenobacter sp.]